MVVIVRVSELLFVGAFISQPCHTVRYTSIPSIHRLESLCVSVLLAQGILFFLFFFFQIFFFTLQELTLFETQITKKSELSEENVYTFCV